MLTDYRLRRHITPYLFLVPAVALFTVYLFGPLVFAGYMSLFRWPLAGVPRPILLRNYRLIVSEQYFRDSLVHTVVYTSAVPLKVGLALVLAVLVERSGKAIPVLRSAFFFPWVLSSVIVGLIWQTILTPNHGFLNLVLSSVGIPGQRWLVRPDRAMLAIVLVTAWHGLGVNLIIFIAGLKTIPRSRYEAAEIDGASSWQSFWFITLPGLRPTTVFVFVVAVIGSFKVFDIVYIMTGGGPAGATTTLVMYIYETAFDRFRMGQASAAAYLFFLILLTLTVLQRKVLSAGVDE
jgi:multiple sugar transport system permease protein